MEIAFLAQSKFSLRLTFIMWLTSFSFTVVDQWHLDVPKAATLPRVLTHFRLTAKTQLQLQVPLQPQAAQGIISQSAYFNSQISLGKTLLQELILLISGPLFSKLWTPRLHSKNQRNVWRQLSRSWNSSNNQQPQLMINNLRTADSLRVCKIWRTLNFNVTCLISLIVSLRKKKSDN